MEFCPGEPKEGLDLESSAEGGRLQESPGKPLLSCHIYFGQLGEIKTKKGQLINLTKTEV